MDRIQRRHRGQVARAILEQLRGEERTRVLLSEEVATVVHAVVVQAMGRECQSDDDEEHYALEDRLGDWAFEFIIRAAEGELSRLHYV